MAKVEKKKIDKNTIPEDFTMTLALVDAIPVVFFGLNALLLGKMCGSALFVLGALLCLIGGAGKVLWKIIVVLKKKNIWPLFVQMRVLMPVGFVLMAIGVVAKKISIQGILHGFFHFPSVIFFLAGIAGLCLMIVFASKLDSSDVRANWIEQLTNGIGQIAIFVGLILML